MRIFALCLAMFALTARAEPEFITFPSDVDWVTRESPHFIALYRRGQDRLAIRSLGHAENSHKLLSPIFPHGPEKTWMVLADFSDSTNGYALNVPYPHMVIFTVPPEPHGILANLDDWLSSVILHEYTHILHIFPAKGLWKPMRAIFGSWVMPNALMPSHLHEGIATFLETQLTEGGRGRGAAFQMYRRKAVEAGVWGKDFAPLDLLDGSSTRWPHGVSPYFFGYQLYEALWKSQGAKGIYRLTDSYSSNWPFFINTPLEDVFGVDYRLLWDRAFDMGEKTARAQLDIIKKEPLAKLNYLTSDRGGKWDLVAAPSGDHVAFRSGNWNRKTQIVIYDLAQRKAGKAYDIARGSDEGICWGGIGERESFFLVEGQGANGYNKNLLKSLNLASGEKAPLLVGKTPLEHIHLIGCNRELSTVFAFRESGGVGVLLELKTTLPTKDTAGTAELGRQWKIPEASWISAIAVDGKQNGWFVLRTSTRSQILRWSPGEDAPKPITEVAGHIHGLKAGESDSRIQGIWDKDGRSEIWEFETTKGGATKMVALTGGALSFARAGTRWIVSSYEHGGYDLAEALPQAGATGKSVSFKNETLAASRLKDRRKPAAAAAVSDMKEYSPWSTLLPRFWIPFLMVVPDGLQISAWIPGFDIGQKHFYGLYAGYDTRGSGTGFVSLSHSYRFGLSSQLSSSAYFQPSYLISSGQLLTQWGGSVSLSGKLFGWDPAVSIGMAFKKLEASNFASGQTQFNPTPKISIGPQVTLTQSFGVEQEPTAILPRWGTALSTTVAFFPKVTGSTDEYVLATATALQYFPVPWAREHGFFLRARAGYTDGTSLLNSYFEGGGELLFSFGRGPFLNRGFVPGAFLARRIFTLNAEYHLLLGRPERGAGLSPVFFRSWELAFIGDISTHDAGIGPPPSRVRNTNDIFKVYYASVGSEIKANFKLGFYLPMSLRLGVYHGFGDTGGTRPKGEPLYFVAAVEGSFF